MTKMLEESKRERILKSLRKHFLEAATGRQGKSFWISGYSRKILDPEEIQREIKENSDLQIEVEVEEENGWTSIMVTIL